MSVHIPHAGWPDRRLSQIFRLPPGVPCPRQWDSRSVRRTSSARCSLTSSPTTRLSNTWPSSAPTNRATSASGAHASAPTAPGGTVTLGLVAQQLHLHPRPCSDGWQPTEQPSPRSSTRREGIGRPLSARREDHTVSPLTRALGYAEQSVLTRSCNRWFGCGPNAYRRQSRMGNPRGSWFRRCAIGRALPETVSISKVRDQREYTLRTIVHDVVRCIPTVHRELFITSGAGSHGR